MNQKELMKLSAKCYYEMIQYELNICPIEGIFEWLKKYPIYHKSRDHLFDIAVDINKIGKSLYILDQGAAEGIFCRILQDYGHKIIAADIEPKFLSIWNKLNINGLIVDCTNVKWWTGSKFDIIIAAVWPTCVGSKDKNKTPKIDKMKKERILSIKESWKSILNDGGFCYFDVDRTRFEYKEIEKIFSDMNPNIIVNNHRLIIRVKK